MNGTVIGEWQALAVKIQEANPRIEQQSASIEASSPPSVRIQMRKQKLRSLSIALHRSPLQPICLVQANALLQNLPKLDRMNGVCNDLQRSAEKLHLFQKCWQSPMTAMTAMIAMI